MLYCGIFVEIQKYGSDMRVQLHGAAASTEVGMYATSCIAHCQSIENEHPEALWHWEGRWGINATTAGLPKGENQSHLLFCFSILFFH